MGIVAVAAAVVVVVVVVHDTDVLLVHFEGR